MSGTRAISTTSRRELSSSFFFFFPARQGAGGNSRHFTADGTTLPLELLQWFSTFVSSCHTRLQKYKSWGPLAATRGDGEPTDHSPQLGGSSAEWRFLQQVADSLGSKALSQCVRGGGRGTITWTSVFAPLLLLVNPYRTNVENRVSS